RAHPRAPPFPYTTLFRSGRAGPSDRKGALAWVVAAALGAGLLVPLAGLARAGPPAAIQLPEGTMAALQQQQGMVGAVARPHHPRSEEHTSELQSLAYLVC